MKKHWTITGDSTKQYETYDLAVDAAKRKAERYKNDEVYILEAVATIKAPAPAYDVIKL